MSDNINIVARRIFNKLSEDISDRRGLKQEWSSISPNVMKLEIRRAWEQIFTEEVEKHANELQSKVSDLEEANRSNRIVMSALQNAHEMEKARVKRLEEALGFGVGLNRARELMSDNHVGEPNEMVAVTKEVPCPDCYGGHFRPCNICGDSGVALLRIETKESKP